MTAAAPQDVHVDREVEMTLFRQMAADDGPAHVLLIQAAAGMGKSTLMRAFWSACEGVPRARINFKGTAYSIEEVLSIIAQQLNPHGFEEFRRELERPMEAVRISAGRIVTAFSDLRIEVSALGQEFAQRQKQRHHTLTHKLMTGLEKANPGARPVVLLLDTFDEATEETRRWISSSLIWEVMPNRWLKLVIAGRSTPLLDHEEWWIQRTLEMLRLEHVHDYARKVRLTLSDDQIFLIYALTDGRPLEVAMQLSKLCEKLLGGADRPGG